MVTTVASSDQSARAVAALDAVKQTLAGISDEATATAALPSLREQSAKLLDVRDIAEKAAPSERATLASKLTPLLPDLDAKIAATLKTPTIEPIIGPLLRQITERAKALAKG